MILALDHIFTVMRTSIGLGQVLSYTLWVYPMLGAIGYFNV